MEEQSNQHPQKCNPPYVACSDAFRAAKTELELHEAYSRVLWAIDALKAESDPTGLIWAQNAFRYYRDQIRKKNRATS